MKIFEIKTLEQTQILAASLAEQLQVGDIIALYGTLGVGKTAFTRFLIQSLCGEQEEVPSPTFTLLQTYDTDDFSIYHYDLYRLKQPDEVFELGIEDAFYDGVSLIEWPEKMGNILPAKKILKIEISCADNIRTFKFSSDNLKWKDRLDKWNVQI
jgi:tRNA threonylcarbamoyladenosine biosynthesis protein TsaE